MKIKFLFEAESYICSNYLALFEIPKCGAAVSLLAHFLFFISLSIKVDRIQWPQTKC